MTADILPPDVAAACERLTAGEYCTPGFETVGVPMQEYYDLRDIAYHLISILPRIREAVAALRETVPLCLNVSDLASEWSHSVYGDDHTCDKCEEVKRCREVKNRAESALAAWEASGEHITGPDGPNEKKHPSESPLVIKTGPTPRKL